MSRQTPQGLQPKLRFPEFRDSGDWERCLLTSKVTKVGSGITPTGGDKNYKTKGRPFIRSQNVGWGKLLLNDVAYIDEETHSSFSATEIKSKDVLLNITGASIGRSAIAEEKIVGGNVNQHVCIIRVKSNELLPELLNQFLLSEHGQKQIDGFQAGGNRQGLNFAQVRSFFIPLPTIIKEQQKIADCLSSLDELIEAERGKLETLKTYKKGLMQRLFPAEGETAPKLRFPEFQAAGDWEKKELGELLINFPEYGVNEPAVPYSKNLPTYLRITDISEEGRFLSSNKVSVAIEATGKHFLQNGDIVLARTGASVGKSYKYREEDGKLVFAGFLIRVRPAPTKLDSTFLFNFLSTRQYWKWVNITSARSGQPGINGSEYASLPVPIPTDKKSRYSLSEQQKIADCLSSLDDLIAAQSHKIDVLKEHKKGLMQQLFPAINEAQA